MPFPRLSATLNNCALHALTPELKDEIAQIAANRELSLHIAPAYQLLKNQFALFYGLEELTFHDFNRILQGYNDFDVQLLLGPVLRSVMEKFMADHYEEVALLRIVDDSMSESDDESFRQYKTNLQNDGRYVSLSPDELFVFLTKHFRMRIEYHQNGRNRILPDNDPEQDFQGRPVIKMYHEGGIDGAGAGGHWERTATAAERIYYEEDASTKLHVFTALLGNEYTLTNYGLELLKKHVQLTYQGGNAQDFDILKLTVAQIEKFIYNREYVDKDCSKQLLGPLTGDAEYVIARLPEIDREYDANFRALIDSNLPENRRFVPPAKRRYSTLDYQIALTLLTPPTIQSQAAHRDEIDQHQIWHLRANEISILDVEYIVYDHGLSAQLYAVCNREDITTQLSEEFLQMLAADPNFVTNASSLLQSLVAKLPSTKQNAESQMAPTIPTYSIVFDTLDSLIREEQHDKIPSPLIDPSPVISTNIQPPTITADFYLRCAKYFFIAGGIFAILALLTCPPVATVLGIAGATATKVAVISTGFAVTTLLTGLSIFVLRRNAHPNRERAENTESLSNFASPSSH